jgi:hypothetical protein
MSNALTTVDLTQLPSTQLGTDEQFEQMARNTTFLGRLQLFSKGNAINEGLIPPGTYGIPESDKKIVNLGKSIDILPLARRLKALDLSDKEAIVANYDAKSDAFKDIAARSEETDSNCMYGTSFLVLEKGSGRFLELFCGTKSTRPIAGDIAVFMALSQAQIDAKKAAGADVSQMKPHPVQPCTLKVRVAKNKRGHSWHVPDVQPCTSPFTTLPAMEVIVDEINKFLTEKNGGTEVVKEDPSKKARAR